MARLRRMVLPGQVHVIVQRAPQDLTVFVDDRDRANYLLGLREAARGAGVAVHGYGLLAHEVRLLATPRDEPGLALMMQSVGRRFVRQINQRHGRSGTVWEGRFRSAVIEASPHFLACLRFVEGWSIGGSSVSASEDAPDSSAAYHLDGAKDPLIEPHPVYWHLGNTPFEREVRYREWLAQPRTETELATILRACMHGWVLGSEAFAAEAAERSGRQSRPTTPGRPRGADKQI
ncbi:MAG: transposase [Caldimonas sp.]